MNDLTKNENGFVGYEYAEVTVPRSMEGLWTDSYKSFGWNLTRSGPTVVKPVWGPIRLMVAPLALIPGSPFAKVMTYRDSAHEVVLTFKRDRSIANKAELVRAQSQFEAYANEIARLEKSTGKAASAVAYTIGGIGTGLMAGSVFSLLAGALLWCIALGAVGIIGWILPAFVQRKMRSAKEKSVEIANGDRYDSIYDICAKGNALLQF